MSFNLNKLAPGYKPEGPSPHYAGVYLGIVRANADPQRMGRISVWISNFGPDKEEFWVTVSYASPFGGVTPMEDVQAGSTSMDGSQKSYGWWAQTPDLGNQVLVCFVNGEVSSGFYFACLYPQNMNHMVPGLAFGDSPDSAMNQQFAPLGAPVVEYNKKTTGSELLTSTQATGQDNSAAKRPVFTPLAQGLIAQGLQGDSQRGPSNTSARRESPSNVYGYSSPRGNTIHIDDGFRSTPKGEPDNEFIRLRTRSGAQILIHETSGYIYMITKGGDSWVEISDTGIDMFSKGMISLASGSDVNIQAGGAINMHGSTGVNIKAAAITSFTSGDTNFVTGGDFLTESEGDIFFRANNTFGIEAVKNIGIDAGKDVLMAACGVISRNAKTILDNSGGPAPDPVKEAHYVQSEVTTRVPTHEPFAHGDSASTASTVTGFSASGVPLTTVVNGDGTVNQVPVKIPKTFDERAKILYKILKQRGYNDAMIAAMLGVWTQESGLMPTADEKSGGNGLGLAQWSVPQGNRRAQLINYASTNNKPLYDYNTQVDFFEYELAHNEHKAGALVKSATTLPEAMAAMKQFERFGVAGKRESYAEGYLKKIQAGEYSG